MYYALFWYFVFFCAIKWAMQSNHFFYKERCLLPFLYTEQPEDHSCVYVLISFLRAQQRTPGPQRPRPPLLGILHTRPYCPYWVFLVRASCFVFASHHPALASSGRLAAAQFLFSNLSGPIALKKEIHTGTLISPFG